VLFALLPLLSARDTRGFAMTSDSPASGKSKQRLLAIVTVDVMAWKLLRPWLHALRDDGYDLHLACSDSGWVEHLIADGFRVHKVPLRRKVNPFVHIAPLWQLYRLIRRGRFEIV